MGYIVDSFKKGVPSSKQLYSKYSIEGITYKKFKKQFCEMKEIKKYLLSMSKEEYLTKKEVHNVFKYLNNLKYNKFSDVKREINILNDLKYNKFSDVKREINILNDLRDSLKEKVINLSERDTELLNCIKHILLHINMLKDTIADRIDLDIVELEKIIEFENITERVLKSDNVNDSLKLIFSNLELLGECTDFKGRDFNMLLYNSVYNAKYKKRERFLYYKNLLNYIINIKCLKINKDVFYDLIEINNISFDNGALQRKISLLKYDSKSNRYILDYDNIITVDNEILLDESSNIKCNATKRIDDGLSIEKTNEGSYLLGIHIADVYSLGNFKTEKDFYNVKCIDNRQGASLNANKAKNAISLLIEIDQNGIIRDYKLLKTIVKPNINLVYSDISKIILQDNVDSNLKKTVIELAELYTIIDNDNFNIYPTIQNIAHSLVKKYMILYGCIISECFMKYNSPGIYLCGDGRKNNYYSILANDYNSGFKNYRFYSKSTSPIYDQSSLVCQFLLHEYVFKSKGEESKNMTIKYITKVVDSLNKNH